MSHSALLKAFAGPFAACLALSGCTGGAGAAGTPSSAVAEAAPEPAPKPAAADQPAEAPKKDPAPAEQPKPLPAASPESVAKVKALMGRMDSEVAEERETAWNDLKDMGDLATPALVAALKIGSAPERRNAARAIGLLQDKAGAEVLRAALADQDVDVRWQAARALGEIGDAGSKGALARLLKEDADSTVREYAAYALAALGADEGFGWFKEELKAKEASRRSRAVKALGKYGGGKFIPELAAALKDVESRVRAETVIQLGGIRQKDAVEPLIAALGDEDYKIRERARSALEKLTFVDDLGSDKAKWEAWWAANKEKFKVSATGKPEPHAWENAVSLKGDADFKKNVEEAKGLVAVDFHVPNAPDCIRVARALDKLAAEYKGRLTICEAEAKANMAAIRKLGLKKAPTVVVFKDGKRVETVPDVKTEAEYKTIFDEHLAGTRKVDLEKEKAFAPPPAKAGGLPANVVNLHTEAELKDKVEGGKGLAVVLFGPDDHADAKRQASVILKLAMARKDVTFFGTDFAPSEELAGRLGIERGGVAVVFFRDGAKVEAVAGFLDEAPLGEKLDSLLKAGGPIGNEK